MDTVQKSLLCSTIFDEEVSVNKGNAFTVLDSLRSKLERVYSDLVKERDEK